MSADVPQVHAPPAEPQAIRACLGPSLVAEFDNEWNLALDEAKQRLSLGPIHDLLHKWRFIAYGELQEPGSHARMLAQADQIKQLGHNPDEVPAEDMHALINRRLGR